MADTNKIFKRLQEYIISPPPGLYVKLWKQIRRLRAGKNLLPDTDILPDRPDKDTEGQNIFSSLQNYTQPGIDPPPFDIQKIKKAIADDEVKNSPTEHKSGLIWFYRTVAAAAVITGILFFVNRNKPHSEDQPPVAAQTIVPNTIHAQQGSETQDKKTQNTDIAVMKPSETVEGAVAPKLSSRKKNSQPFYSIKKTGIENTVSTNIALRNNDFFYTLTNFNIPEANYFLESVQKEKKVVSGNFSYVNVSDKMAECLKQLYAVNRRNKYTWKARRMRAKLNRWKKEDAGNFDIKKGKDPLDILDLSEFLFKK